eukprot:1821269-Amphidinium_carterae.2
MGRLLAWVASRGAQSKGASDNRASSIRRHSPQNPLTHVKALKGNELADFWAKHGIRCHRAWATIGKNAGLEERL